MKEKMTYETAMAQLETIAHEMENNETPIDQLADKLKQAQQLIEFCKARLTATEQEIQALTADNQEV